jgi:LacI family transcriptional regulator
MVTIKDIAERAGVAKSTVSNALTGKKYVSEELKQKILDRCDEMNYSPNFYASRLSGNRTNIISLFLEESETGVYHSFYTELIESCLKYLSKHGYHLLISYNSDKRMRNSFLQKGKAPVDGAIIMAPVVNDQRITQFESDLVPCVSIGKPDESHSISCVDIDNFKLVADAVNILTSNGYKKIYLINSNESLNISRERTTSFLKALSENLLDGGVNNISYSAESSFEDGYSVAFEKIEENTAFITANVRLAEGVYAAAAQKGLEIGKNVGVFALGGQKNPQNKQKHVSFLLIFFCSNGIIEVEIRQL